MRPRTVLLLTVLTAAVVYTRYVRPWQLTWGATPAEVSRSLPSDGLVERPTFNATRAITIDAAPQEVWPWLVQAGVTRAGWYSYDLLDNLGRRSARRIIPELQNLAEGDVIPMSPDGKQGMPVHSMDAPHSMVWGEPGGTTWAWQLDETADGSTRLINPRALSLPVAVPIDRLFSAAGVRRRLDDAEDAAEPWGASDDVSGLRARSHSRQALPTSPSFATCPRGAGALWEARADADTLG